MKKVDQNVEDRLNDAMLAMARTEAARERIEKLYVETTARVRELEKESEQNNKQYQAAKQDLRLAMQAKLDLLKLVT